MQRYRAGNSEKCLFRMERRLHEGVAILQYLLRVDACSRRRKGRNQTGMREQNSTSIQFRTT
jgi:hypothetical protein